MSDHIDYPIHNPFPGAIVIYKDVVESTMDDAKYLIDSGVAHGSVVWTSFQTKGRGRFPEREWLSEQGKNLLLTVMLKTDRIGPHPGVIPLVCGLAVSRTIDECGGFASRVKWPNDVLVGGKKCAGILCESVKGWILAGIGINCNQSDFPPSLLSTATSLARETGKTIDRPALLSQFLKNLDGILADAAWMQGLNERLAFVHERKRIMIGHPYTDNHTIVEGTVERVDEEGNLVVARPDRTSEIIVSSGEILF